VIPRRAFVGSLIGGLLAAPLVAVAQQPNKVPRVGFLIVGTRSDPAVQRTIDVFRQGLHELGYQDGQITMDYRSAEAHQERLPDLAAELVRLRPDVIVALASQSAQAAAGATKAIPIVTVTNDPVAGGFAATIRRPTRNITGLSLMAPELVGKQLELLKEVVPTLARVAVLGNPANPGNVFLLGQVETAARAVGIRLQPLQARDAREIGRAFEAMKRDRVDALLVLVDPVLGSHRETIAHLATKAHLPAVYGVTTYAETGRRAAIYVDRILKGAKPADLPVEQPTTFELIINLKTAKALGLTIPPSLLARADQVIE